MATERGKDAERALLVVEVSLGSSARDHDVEVEFLGGPTGSCASVPTATWARRRRSCAAGASSPTRSRSTARPRRWPPGSSTSTPPTRPPGWSAAHRPGTPPTGTGCARCSRSGRCAASSSRCRATSRTPEPSSSAPSTAASSASCVSTPTTSTSGPASAVTSRTGSVRGRSSVPRPGPRRGRCASCRTAVQDEVLLPAELAEPRLAAPGAAGLRRRRRRLPRARRRRVRRPARATVITSTVTDEQLADLASRDVDLVIDSTPQPFDVTVDVASLEAMMRAAVARPAEHPSGCATTTSSR